MAFRVFLFLLLLSAPAYAASSVPAPLPVWLDTEPLPAAEKQLFAKNFGRYISSLTTLRGSFTQSNPDGSSLRGTLALQRPNKLRLEYAPPPRWLFVGTGSAFVYYDADVQQVSYLSQSDSPLALLLNPQTSLSHPELSYDVYRSAAQLFAVFSFRGGAPVTLVFAEAPLRLSGWLLLDSAQQLITVTLDDVQQGMPLAASLFQFVDPNRPR